MNIKYLSILLFSIMLSVWQVCAIPINGGQKIDYAQEISKTIMHKWPDSLSRLDGKSAGWSYDIGLFLEAIANVYARTGDQTYFDYIQKQMDRFLLPDGNIKFYDQASYNIDYVRNGKIMIYLFEKTDQQKYADAAKYIRQQLYTHPRTSEGGFWHKKRYPHQMWLDGLYMGQPFYAHYSKVFNEPNNFDDIAKQFILMEKYSRDSETGLLHHAWDESKKQRWSNRQTGKSPNIWGRAMGWYGTALVDVLEYFPEDHPKRDTLLAILNRFVEAVAKVQHPSNGVWYQVVDKASQEGNYPEASASSMFVYTMLKGSRLGYISPKYRTIGKKGYEGLIKQFIEKGDDGYYHLNGTVMVSGLGGDPYRDGSFEYYMSEPVIQDDPKGMGAFVLAANEAMLE
ncbi:glycoside hydrolase family 88/105 protein [Sphingobacterium arenae]|uniref:Glycoside hydrolase family 88 protein n=1 Tax=Sphingobacterium arenae TaxID=1280598 RepID=A0ABR7Y4M8_9SPHI|nr:glycoside hydrolase family 88 protein [Sphingobacterium arenae]MBD1426208.1 glycoside hydrolase family 88 protein [Sphingobacterium arenae]